MALRKTMAGGFFYIIIPKEVINMSKLEQIKALENGKGIQYLLDAAYKIFQNPIAMFDTNYDLKVYADVASDDPLWNELISTGTFSMKTQEFFAQECFTEDVANANKLVILKSSKLKHDRILGYIFNRDNIKVGMIVMVGLDTLLDAEDKAAFEELADKITSEIHDDDYFTAYGRAYHEGIIIKLLDRVIKDPLIYNPHVQIFLEGFEDYFYVAVVDIIQNNSHQNSLAYFKNLLESKYRSFKYAIYSDYIVMVMSSKHRDFYEEHFFDKDNNPFKQNNLFVGISDSFENPYELREYYDKAVTVLKNGIEKNNDRRVFLYNNI